MKAITNTQLTSAAEDHAKKILGEKVFKENSDAAKAIQNDFIAGAQFMLKTVTDLKEDAINLVDKDLSIK